MIYKKFITVALLSATGFFCGNELSAWQKEAMNDCKKQEKKCDKQSANCKKEPDKCKKDAEACKKNVEACKKDATHKDMSSFASALSPAASAKFQKFTPDQKKKAMDYADHNKMTPDDAVNKVFKK